MVGLLTKLGFGSAPLLQRDYSLFCITARVRLSGAGSGILQNAAFPRRFHPQSSRSNTVFWAPLLEGAPCEAGVSISSDFWS